MAEVIVSNIVVHIPRTFSNPITHKSWFSSARSVTVYLPSVSWNSCPLNLCLKSRQIWSSTCWKLSLIRNIEIYLVHLFVTSCMPKMSSIFFLHPLSLHFIEMSPLPSSVPLKLNCLSDFYWQLHTVISETMLCFLSKFTRVRERLVSDPISNFERISKT